ncbi:IS21 family transposase [Bengtsoniella intestinalis]|uniref:IS21 family transposase n=1 Tax=Bengtsoniella intestinalis TaxID=3073143 RepID=UPI00391FA5D1
MAQKNYIKDLYENQEKSLNEIAKITGLNYRTVRKYAHKDDWNDEHLPNIQAESYPILGDFIPIIDQWLEDDTKIPRKQRHTIWRIYCRLRDEEKFLGSYSSVKRYVRKKKFAMSSQTDGYLPLAHPHGSGQVDFGEHIYNDASSKVRTGYALTLSFPNSNKGYTQDFPAQNQECLLEGMKQIFEHMGGVPPVIRFDNMSTAVVKVLDHGERVLTDGFTRFMLHYRFKAEFCNPAAGNEKGNVENKVGYSRRNAFVPVPTITSFDTFNEQLFDWCEQDAQRLHYKHQIEIQELWEADREALLPLPEHPFSVFRYESLAVNKYGFVTIDTNKYGLSPALSREIVQAKIYYDCIEFYHDHTLVGSYKRSYETHQEYYDWKQYVGVLCRKPGGVSHTRFFNQMPPLWQQHLHQAQGQARKSALQLLDEIVQDGNATFCDEVLELAHENGRTDADSVRQCYYMIAKKEHRPEPLTLDITTPDLHYTPNLSAYDGLIGGDLHG